MINKEAIIRVYGVAEGKLTAEIASLFGLAPGVEGSMIYSYLPFNLM